MYPFDKDDIQEFHDLRDRMRDLAQRVHGSDHPLAVNGWRLPDKSTAIGLFAEVHAHHHLEMQFMKRAIATLEFELYAQPYHDLEDAWRPSSRHHAKPIRAKDW